MSMQSVKQKVSPPLLIPGEVVEGAQPLLGMKYAPLLEERGRGEENKNLGE
jgi:hypothetical protein